jgi:hypothetical protein
MPETVFTTERPQNQPCQGGSRDDPEMDADAAIVVSAIVQAWPQSLLSFSSV